MLSENQKKSAIKEPPTLLETFAFGYFFTGTLVGPQFSLNRMRLLVTQKLGHIGGNEIKETRFANFLLSCF